MKNSSALLEIQSFALATLLLSSAITVAADIPLAFVKKHCSDCHSSSSSEGGFSVDTLTNQLAEPANHKAWNRVLARVQSGEMPPPLHTDQPSGAEISQALTTLKQAFYADGISRRENLGVYELEGSIGWSTKTASETC